MELTELLQALQALGDRPKITLSVEVQRNTGEYEHVTGKAFLTWICDPTMTQPELLENYVAMNHLLYVKAEEEADASYKREIARKMADAENFNPISKPPLKVPGQDQAMAEGFAMIADDGTEEEVAPPVGGGVKLKYAPKAANRHPGDWWEEVATKCKVTAEEKVNPNTGKKEVVATVDFGKEGFSGSVGSVKSWMAIYPKQGWWYEYAPDSEADGIVRNLKAPVKLTLRVSEKKIEKTGNYRVDVIKIE